MVWAPLDATEVLLDAPELRKKLEEFECRTPLMVALAHRKVSLPVLCRRYTERIERIINVDRFIDG